MQLKDHYKTLGVKPSANMPDIKKAYRGLAVKYHPDKNPGNNLAEVLFKEISEAYRVLSDVRRRTAYDDERWLSGMGARTSYNEAITPAWLKNVCVELNSSLNVIDTHRMSQQALQAYILLIVSDAHLAVLLDEGDTHINRSIINHLLKATAMLEPKYLDEVLKQLLILAGNDHFSQHAIEAYSAVRSKQERMERLFPFIVISVTLALCIFMYFYGSTK
jgi:hypothetical protein